MNQNDRIKSLIATLVSAESTMNKTLVELTGKGLSCECFDTNPESLDVALSVLEELASNLSILSDKIYWEV